MDFTKEVYPTYSKVEHYILTKRRNNKISFVIKRFGPPAFGATYCDIEDIKVPYKRDPVPQLPKYK